MSIGDAKLTDVAATWSAPALSSRNGAALASYHEGIATLVAGRSICVGAAPACHSPRPGLRARGVSVWPWPTPSPVIPSQRWPTGRC